MKYLEKLPALDALWSRARSSRWAGVPEDRIRFHSIDADDAKRELSVPTQKERKQFEQDKPSWVIDEIQPIGILRGYSSTRLVDSYRELLHPSGWEKHLPKFLEYPIYLYGHDYWSMPIGLVNRLEIDEFGLWTERFIFNTQAGQEAWLLVRAGVLRADSVGYILHDWETSDIEGVDEEHTEMELIEDSLVMLPANRGANIESIEVGGGGGSAAASEDIEHINSKLVHLSQIPVDWPEKQFGAAPHVRRSDTMSIEKTQEVVRKEIQETLKPYEDRLKVAQAEAGQVKEQVENLVRTQNEATDAIKTEILGKLQKNSSDLQEKLDKIVPDFATKQDELAKKIAELEKKVVPTGSLSTSPFSSRQLSAMPMHEVRAAHTPDFSARVDKFQELTNHLVLLDLFLECQSMNHQKDYHTQNREERIKKLKLFETWENHRKALDTATATEGTEWVPTGMAARIYDRIRLSLRLAGSFQTVQMPTNPYTAPVLGADTIAKLIGETTAMVGPGDTTNEENIATAKVTWTAVRARGRVQLSDEFNEDAILPMLPYIETAVVRSIARAEDTAVLNGDTTATHMDSDVTAATDFRKAFNGLRDLTAAGAKKNHADAAFGTDDDQLLRAMRAARATMGAYGEIAEDLIAVSSLYVILTFLMKCTGVQTLDKFGPNAVILTGQIASIDGQAVIASEFCRDDLNATGVYDGTTTDNSMLQIANKNAYVMGERGPVQVGSEFYLLHQVHQVVAWHRVDFQPLYAPATNLATSQVYNID